MIKAIFIISILNFIGFGICQMNPGVSSTLTQNGLNYGNTKNWKLNKNDKNEKWKKYIDYG